MDKNQAIRFNEGKLRYDLINPIAIQGLAKVLTAGAIKYAPRNWEKGLSWTSVIASAERHLQAYKRGEDFDPETGLKHIDHLQANAHFLSAYYHIAPQFDDRNHQYLTQFKIGLDIDEVLCNWTLSWTQKFGYDIPENWNFSYNNEEHFKSFTQDELNDFYINIPPKISPKDLPFEPCCYITSRSVPTELTMQWLQNNGFPTVKVYSVPYGSSKVTAAKESGCDVFIDDHFMNFVELNKAGICCFLYDAPHNQKYDVGYKRIKSFTDLMFI